MHFPENRKPSNSIHELIPICLSVLHAFPCIQLREILDLPEAKEMIEWLPGGEAFAVLKSFDLASQILPRYFKSGQYESFVRKLNRWGFRRDSRGRRTGAFYHENFIRDRPDLMAHMSNRRAVANPRGLGPKHLRGVAGSGMNPPPGAATAAAAAAAADRAHANATMGLGLGVNLDSMSGMSDADFLALRHRQMARHHAAAAAQAAAGGMAGAYPPMGTAAAAGGAGGDPMQSAPGFLEAYAAHEASRMGLRQGSAAAGAPGANPPGSSAVTGAPGLPPPLPSHAASMGHLGTSPHALHGDALLQHRHFLGAGADPLIQEASLVGRANGTPQLAAAAADLAEAEAELVRLRSRRALRAGGALPPHHAHMAHLAPGAVPGSMAHLAGPGASATGMPPLPAAGAPMPSLPSQAGEAPASTGMAAPADAALAAALAAAPGAPAPPPSAEAAAAGAAAGDPAQIAYLRHQQAIMRTQESRALLNQSALANPAPGASPPAAAANDSAAPAAADPAAAPTGNKTGSV